jgi:hypothetical protein
VNEEISLFDLTTLPFELDLRLHHVLMASPSSENQKLPNFQKVVFFQKKRIHESVTFLLDIFFLVKEITTFNLNFT